MENSGKQIFRKVRKLLMKFRNYVLQNFLDTIKKINISTLFFLWNYLQQLSNFNGANICRSIYLSIFNRFKVKNLLKES